MVSENTAESSEVIRSKRRKRAKKTSKEVTKKKAPIKEKDNTCNPSEDEDQDANENDADVEPTLSTKKQKLSGEIKEKSQATKGGPKSSKPPSRRQLKREKAEQRENEKKEAVKLEATQKALAYISKWKHSRDQWKFEKLRQVWLLENLLDDSAIPDDIFPVVLEYFEGCKGMARQQLLKKAMEVIKKAEEETEKNENVDEEPADSRTVETTETIAYKRARQLLQALPSDS